ncbi:MAG: hypothetical protein U0R49_02860 [Fimbriimonadales bacterium]
MRASSFFLLILTFNGVFADSRSAVEYEQLVRSADTLANLEKAVSIYNQNGDVWRRLGSARYDAKKFAEAIEAHKMALKLGGFENKFFANTHFDIACCLARLGKTADAFKELEIAMSLGFRDLNQVQKDTDLDPLHSDKRWPALSGTDDVTKMSRDDAWRYDARLMVREAQRIHYDPFIHFPKKEQEIWLKTIQRDIPKMNDNEIKIAFMKYMVRLGDGHTGIRTAEPEKNPILPLQLYWFEEGIYVIAASKDHGELVGRKVTRVAGHDIMELMKAVEPTIWRDNPQGIRSAAPSRATQPWVLNGLGFLTDLSGADVTTIGDSGDSKTVFVQAKVGQPDATWVNWLERRESPLYLQNRAKPYHLVTLPELGAVYVQYNSVRNDPAEVLSEFSSRLTDTLKSTNAQRLIVDVRFNGGGNTFLSRPLVSAIITNPVINKRGHLFVITGRQTFSAAQNFTTDLGRAAEVIYVGEPTGSSPNFVGETVRFTLPYSKMQGSISDLYWQRSWPMDSRIWIAPDLPAPPTFAAFKANIDPAMDAIREYIGKG